MSIMPRLPHTLDYHSQVRDDPHFKLLSDHFDNFFAGALLSFSVAIIAVHWIDKHIIKISRISDGSLAPAVTAFGLLTTLFAIILFLRRRRFPVGVITGARHGLLAGIGLAITLIGLYFFVLSVLAFGD